MITTFILQQKWFSLVIVLLLFSPTDTRCAEWKDYSISISRIKLIKSHYASLNGRTRKLWRFRQLNTLLLAYAKEWVTLLFTAQSLNQKIPEVDMWHQKISSACFVNSYLAVTPTNNITTIPPLPVNRGQLQKLTSPPIKDLIVGAVVIFVCLFVWKLHYNYNMGCFIFKFINNCEVHK